MRFLAFHIQNESCELRDAKLQVKVERKRNKTCKCVCISFINDLEWESFLSFTLYSYII